MPPRHFDVPLRNGNLRNERGDQGRTQQLEQASAALAHKIIALDVYRQSQRLAVYFAVNGEIGLDPVIDHALAAGKQVYLPNLDQQSLRFSPYFREQKMRINKFRLPEPDVGDDDMLQPVELDLVLAPLVVFDESRNRIGMGGGFYDRSFSMRKDAAVSQPVLIGVAHDLQKVEQIIPEDWDVRLDMVVTDRAIYR